MRGEHGLARTRRAAHQHAVIACGRYLQRAFCRLVARHVAEIGHALLPAQRVGARRLELPRPQAPERTQRRLAHPLHRHVVVRRRAHERASQLPGAQHVRERPRNRTHRPFERKLADEEPAFDEQAVDLLSLIHILMR